jgi:hypothetical protein
MASSLSNLANGYYTCNVRAWGRDDKKRDDKKIVAGTANPVARNDNSDRTDGHNLARLATAWAENIHGTLFQLLALDSPIGPTPLGSRVNSTRVSLRGKGVGSLIANDDK